MIEDEGGDPACWAHLFEDDEDAATDARPTVVGIHVAPASRLPMRSVESVTAEAGAGLVGDRYHGTRHRHVTIQSRAGLDEATASLGTPVDPALTRRNLTISHGEIPTAPGSRIQVGDVALEVVRVAAPCKLLDDTIGPGARDALRRRGGSVCRLLSSGTISVGDEVALDAAGLDSKPAMG
ncbi:MAG: MOSC domain-containing protein [Acidimicrobiales bacterium]|nr:MOSC domain-containing protein [Acidimicrobiales bacterium]